MILAALSLLVLTALLVLLVVVNELWPRRVGRIDTTRPKRRRGES